MRLFYTFVFVFILGLLIGYYNFEKTGLAVSEEVSELANLSYVPGELIIKFKDDNIFEFPLGLDEANAKDLKINKDSISKLNKKHKVEKIEKFSKRNDDPQKIFNKIYKLKLPEKSNLETVAEEYGLDSSVEYVSPNFYWMLMQSPETHRYPNDLYYPWQWALHGLQLNAEQAWNIEKGSTTETIIGVVDTGVDYNHPDLADKYIGGYDYESESGGDDDDPIDRLGHGTAVAGILAAKTNNLMGIAGGCPECKIYAVKVGTLPSLEGSIFSISGSGGFPGTMDDGARGINRAVNAGAKVISVSAGWVCKTYTINGWYYGCEPIEDAVTHASNNDVLVVAAAGNTYFDLSDYGYGIITIPSNDLRHIQPATIQKVLAVAATDQNDMMADFSNSGQFVDVSAPGVGIFTTDIIGENGFSYGDYTYDFFGTSASTPYVAGLAGLIRSNRPELSIKWVTRLIEFGSDRISSRNYIGIGRINYAKTLKFLENDIIDYSIFESLEDYIGTFQRCAVRNIDQSVGWRHDSSTTKYSLTNDGDATVFAYWSSFCSEWDEKNLPLVESEALRYRVRDPFDDSPAMCDKFRWRVNYPASTEFYLSRQNPSRTLSVDPRLILRGGRSDDPGLKLTLEFNNDFKLSVLNYRLNPTIIDYQWDLSCCHGTIDDDGDGWYVDDNCKGARDCNDNRIWINPSATEYCGDNIDENCNGQVSEAGCIDPASISIPTQPPPSPYKNVPFLK